MNERAATLKRQIESKTACVGVVGLGYVGLPLAVMLADAGFNVVGVDVDGERIAAVNAGRWPLDQNEPVLPDLLRRVVREERLTAGDYDALAHADVVAICVPTPIDEYKYPDCGALFSALGATLRCVRPPALVIVESTLPPRTMEDVADVLGAGYWAAHCPERVMPSKLYHNLRFLPRVIGGWTADATELAAALYLNIIWDTELYLTDALTAEIVKCAENAYRDVGIAFANELATICDGYGADVWEVRELVNTCPGRDVLEPGPGVGGPCLTKDSWLLMSGLLEPAHLLVAARAVNDGMAAYVVDLVLDALREARVEIAGATVAVLGVAYRANVGDVRDSPAGKVMAGLVRVGVDVRFYDPHCDGYDGDLVTTLAGADAAVILTGHDEFKGLDWPALGRVMRHAVLVDTRALVKDAPEGFVFRALGRGRYGGITPGAY